MSHNGPRNDPAAEGASAHTSASTSSTQTALSEVDGNDRANYSRVRKAMEYLDECLRAKIKSQWLKDTKTEWQDGSDCGGRLCKLLDKSKAELVGKQSKIVSKGILATFDSSLLCLTLTYAFRLPANFLRAVGTVRRMRNDLAHLTRACLPDAKFGSSFEKLARVVDALGGDAAALKRIRSGPSEDDDIMPILQVDADAKEAATVLKEQGNRYFRAKDCEAAVKSYTDALKYDAKLPPKLSAAIYANRSVARRHLQDYESSLSDAEQACKILPQWFRGHQRAAQALVKLLRYVDAQPAFERAIQLATSIEHTSDCVAAMKVELQNVKAHAGPQERGEHRNAAYLPDGRTSGPYADALHSRSGLNPGNDGAFVRAAEGTSGDLDPEEVKFYQGISAVAAGHEANKAGQKTEAVCQYVKAATQFSHPEGMYNLALMMYYGTGTPQNVREAEMWARKATGEPEAPVFDISKRARLRGQGAAWNMLGNMAANGTSGAVDEVEARKCYEKAAECENLAGLNNLGRYYREGKGGLQVDMDAARAHFLLSAEVGDNAAMSNLGLMELGLGYVAAGRQWLQAGLDHGHADAAKLLENLPKEPILDTTAEATPAQLKLAAKCRQLMFDIFELKARSSNKNSLFKRKPAKPSLEELRLMRRTEYVQQLLVAAELLHAAAKEFYQARDAQSESGIATALTKAARAFRIPDGQWAVKPQVYSLLCLQAKQNPDTADMALLASHALVMESVSAALVQIASMAGKYPEDDDLMVQHACLLLFDGPERNIEKGESLMRRALLAAPERSAARAYRSYLLGAALVNVAVAPNSFSPRKMQEAETLIHEFLASDVGKCHRKTPHAFFQLVTIAVASGRFDKVRELYEKGIEAQENLPPFLREEGGNLQRGARLLVIHYGGGASNVSDDVKVHGGSILPWPSNCPAIARSLSSDISCILKRLRREIASDLQHVALARRTRLFSSTVQKASRWRTGADDGALQDVLLGEMLAPRQDRIFQGRVLTVMVVAAPSQMVEIHMAVEDSRRDSIAISIYNLPPAKARLLVPGCVMRIRNPYLRLDVQGSCRIRVDHPEETVQLEDERIPLCWHCLRVEADAIKLKGCASCEAKYCGVECQRQDCEQNGHKYWCQKNSREL